MIFRVGELVKQLQMHWYATNNHNASVKIYIYRYIKSNIEKIQDIGSSESDDREDEG